MTDAIPTRYSIKTAKALAAFAVLAVAAGCGDGSAPDVTRAATPALDATMQDGTQSVLIEGLLNSNTVDVAVADIGVIAFYRQQVLKIRLMLRERGLGQVRVGGVDDYQGQEARIIFISTVVAKQRPFDAAVDPIGGPAGAANAFFELSLY